MILAACNLPAKPAILRVVAPSPVRPNLPIDIPIELRTTYTNPFDPQQVALDVDYVSPKGERRTMPGFAYRAYRRSVGKATLPIAYNSTVKLQSGQVMQEQTFDRAEILTPVGGVEWRVRLAFPDPGVYRLHIRLRDRGGSTSKNVRVTVAGLNGPAYARVDPRDPTRFRLSDGKPLFPIGCNLGWAGEKGLADYERWIPRYTAAGADWGRVWLGPGWTTFALEREKFGTLDLPNAWRLDQTLALARKHGMRLNLAIDSYNSLREAINWPEWDRSPYNRANGGPLARPGEFWTNAVARKQYRNKLRYLVARWGADPAVFAWEFWNEVDGVSDYDPAKVRAWHAEMGAHLKSLDPYRHLVSTSFGGNGRGAGDESVFALKEMDFSTSHLYGEPDLALATIEAQKRLGALGKPHFVGEIGADASGAREEDKRGLQLHDPLWASLVSNSAGGAMLWWWDSYIDPLGLEKLFRPARTFISSSGRFRDRNYRSVTPSFDWVVPPSSPVQKDLLLIGGPQSWNAAAYNAPRQVKISLRGAEMEGGPLSSLLQGKGNHADLHNPVTFEVDLPRPTTLVLEAQEISGWGGAGLQATLDGKTILDKPFDDPDGDRVTDSLKQFVGEYPVEIPAGRHTVVVTNPGQDWIRIGYRFKGAIESSAPPLIAWAMVGTENAVAWVRHEDWTWREVVENGRTPARVPSTRLFIPGAPSGSYAIRIFDTWTGEESKPIAFDFDRPGGTTITLPPFDHDLAIVIEAYRL